MHQNTMENKPKYEVTEQGKKAIRRDGVRLLSLDGGGVKGISALCTLQSIMEEVKRIEIECGINTSTEERRPKDYFELAVGTSTGGLIALMLFRLDMSVSQSIAAYKEMAGEIFKPSIRGISLARLHSVGDIILWLKLLVTGNGRFSTKPLLKAIDQLVRKYPLDNGDRDQGNEVLLMHKNAGMMVMCSTLRDEGEAILLRSYPDPKDCSPIDDDAMQAAIDLDNIPIKMAALATSAAPTYFPVVTWGKLHFWDGGLLNNNPIQQLWDSRYDLVEEHEQEPKVACILSLGCGAPVRHKNEDSSRKIRLIAMLTKAGSFMSNTEAKHRDFAHHIQRLRDRDGVNSEIKYFRFNTPTGNDQFKLSEYLKMDAMEEYTKKYLEEKEQRMWIRDCAELLVG